MLDRALESPYSLVPHRLLEMDDGNVAVLALRSTGWVILSRQHYSRVRSNENVSEDSWNQLCKAGVAEARTLLDSNSPNAKEFASALLLKLTGACNISCSYCYDYDQDRFRARLAESRIEETISYLLDNRDDLAIAFHGGEPLLRFDLMQRIVAYASSYIDAGKQVKFSIQTNGTLFTDAVVTFLERHSFSVGISLDGNSGDSNKLRISSGKFPTAWEHVEGVFERYPEFLAKRCGILAVVSKSNFRSLPDFALWLQDKNIAGLTFSFLDLTGRGINLHREKLAPEEAVDVYKSIVGLIENGQIERLAVQSILTRIRNFFQLKPRDLCHKGPCGAANEFLVLDANGSFRTCDCVYDDYFLLGSNVEDVASINPARKAIVGRHLLLETEGASCSRCALFGLCGGTCVAKAIATNGHPQSVDPVECAVSKYFYPKVLNEFCSTGEPKLFNYYRKHSGTASHGS